MELTAKAVADWTGDDLDHMDAAALNMIVPAVIVTVTKWHGGPDTWNDRVTMGAIMLASHLYRRRATPGGVAEFGSEGASYVQRHDPQAAMLLGLGGWGQAVIA